jgi:DNA modification methylase
MGKRRTYLELNKIYNENCLTGIDRIDFPLHLVVTSPPYNTDLGNSKTNKRGYDVYDDTLSTTEYLNFITEVFTRVYNKQEDDGRVCINIGSRQSGDMPLFYYYLNLMEKIGYKSYTTMIWEKGSPGHGQVGNRTGWGSWKSPSCPAFPGPFEYILCFYKNSRKLLHKGVTDIERQEFIDWSLSLWSFPPETQQKKMGHPAMFPPELPKRLIKLFSWVGDTVLDPFSGAGTTCMVAKQLNRNYVGFEISPEYCRISNDRIDSITQKGV